MDFKSTMAMCSHLVQQMDENVCTVFLGPRFSCYTKSLMLLDCNISDSSLYITYLFTTYGVLESSEPMIVALYTEWWPGMCYRNTSFRKHLSELGCVSNYLENKGGNSVACN